MNTAPRQHSLTGCRILLCGAGGQVGIALQQIKPAGLELLALGRGALDITNRKAVAEAVSRYRPDWVINAAAYTGVDKAESEPEVAFAINRDGAAHLAQAAAEVNARMVQISTDYVFDGTQVRPYRPDDTVNPINIYGESKLAGERATCKALGEQALILRTAWVYAPHGNNFLTTMLRLMTERETLNVVEDQIGTPTSCYSLGEAILSAIGRGVTGTHHWTDAGVTSWYDFSCAIARYTASPCRIRPVRTEEYPTPARRPACSVLDKQSMRDAIGSCGVEWQQALADTLGAQRHNKGRVDSGNKS